jgi:hypothetical protein
VFGRWFGGRSLQAEDRVWLDPGACEQGLRGDVSRALDSGQAVLLLLRSAIDLQSISAALATHHPRIADDHYAASDLQAHVAASGALGVSRVDALRPAVIARQTRAPLQVHVRGRDARRSADVRLLELLAPWTPAAVVFHHALDDALLRAHTVALKPLLQSLQFRPDECISSGLLTRAIERAQQP